MKHTHSIIILALSSIVSLAVCADDNKLAASTELAEVMGMKANMEAGFDAMLPVINQLATQMGLDAEGQKELKSIYKAWFLEDLDMESVRKQMIQLYADEFTLEELNGLKAFYLTPLGKRTLKALPMLAKKGAEIGMKEAQAKQDELLQRLTPFLEKNRGKK